MSNSIFTFSNTRDKPKIGNFLCKKAIDKKDKLNLTYRKIKDNEQIQEWEKQRTDFLIHQNGKFWGTYIFLDICKEYTFKTLSGEKYINMWDNKKIELIDNINSEYDYFDEYRNGIYSEGYFFNEMPVFNERRVILLERIIETLDRGFGDDIDLIYKIGEIFKALEEKDKLNQKSLDEINFFKDYFTISTKHVSKINNEFILKKYLPLKTDLFYKINFNLLNILKTRNILFCDPESINRYKNYHFPELMVNDDEFISEDDSKYIFSDEFTSDEEFSLLTTEKEIKVLATDFDI